MNRIQDTYYTKQELDGTPPCNSYRPSYPSFIQGEDIKLFFYLNYNGVPVDPTKHELTLILKKMPHAQNQLWIAKLQGGLFPVDKVAGYFYMLMPSEISSYFMPGSYYIDITLLEKSGVGNEVRDTKQVILSFNIDIKLGASSPNPKLQNVMATSVAYDITSGIWTIEVQSTELTIPSSVRSIVLPYGGW